MRWKKEVCGGCGAKTLFFQLNEVSYSSISSWNAQAVNRGRLKFSSSSSSFIFFLRLSTDDDGRIYRSTSCTNVVVCSSSFVCGGFVQLFFFFFFSPLAIFFFITKRFVSRESERAAFASSLQLETVRIYAIFFTVLVFVGLLLRLDESCCCGEDVVD